MPVPDKPLQHQESVWDYPRPPRLEKFAGSITVELGGQVIASTERAWRVLETSHPNVLPAGRLFRGRSPAAGERLVVV